MNRGERDLRPLRTVIAFRPNTNGRGVVVLDCTHTVTMKNAEYRGQKRCRCNQCPKDLKAVA
jgi:hypothetical protein